MAFCSEERWSSLDTNHKLLTSKKQMLNQSEQVFEHISVKTATKTL